MASTLAVVGINPENADMDNPRGEYVREVFYLDATNEYGERREFGQGWEIKEDAYKFIPLAPPVLLWADGDPVYGSEYYRDSDEESNVLEWEQREEYV